MNILVLGGSIRSRRGNRASLLAIARQAQGLEPYRQAVRKISADEPVFCNSEIIAGAALLGAIEAGSEVDYFSLCSLFPPKEEKKPSILNKKNENDRLSLETLTIDEAKLKPILSALQWADGVILATPVYFGDRSSVANKFIQLASIQNRMKDKVYGVVSVGAKRNGGQETCNVYSLYEMLGQGAFGVGNGMPTSQYGGTAVGGAAGHVIEDKWGLLTAQRTGERVAQVAKIIAAGQKTSTTKPLKLTFIVTMNDSERKLRSHIDNLSATIEAKHSHVKTQVIDLVEHDIYRCLGCDICPKDKEQVDANSHCAISNKEDYLEEARRQLSDADGLIICGVNPKQIDQLLTRYQVFTERLRSVRRNDYEWNNKVVTGLCYHFFGATINPIHCLKTMTSYIRHNTIFHRPIDLFNYRGTLLDTGEDDVFDFVRAVELVSKGKEVVSLPSPQYCPYGEGSGYIKGSTES